LEAFDQVPVYRSTDDPDLYQACVLDALEAFLSVVELYYTEATLGRILQSHGCARSRLAATVALGLTGTMLSNECLAKALRDPDESVRGSANDALADIWFRGEGEEQGATLRRIMTLPDHEQRTRAFEEFINEYGNFAEAYNQRAMHFLARGEYRKAVSDCQTALRLNPHHFGAAASMGQCYMQMHKPGAALRAFAHALEINPNLSHLRELLDAHDKGDNAKS
jgi:tetratricopeptide (TPR) repeat protein